LHHNDAFVIALRQSASPPPPSTTPAKTPAAPPGSELNRAGQSGTARRRQPV